MSLASPRIAALRRSQQVLSGLQAACWSLERCEARLKVIMLHECSARVLESGCTGPAIRLGFEDSGRRAA